MITISIQTLQAQTLKHFVLMSMQRKTKKLRIKILQGF